MTENTTIKGSPDILSKIRNLKSIMPMTEDDGIYVDPSDFFEPQNEDKQLEPPLPAEPFGPAIYA